MNDAPPIASFHTPEELLETAKELVASGNAKYYRGAALEALAALEAFVHRTVFPALTSRFSASFSDFLENKTKMDFDSRLSVLAPIATGVPVEKDATLWVAYKQSRALRNGVVHGSKKVTKEEAERIIQNTAAWIAYLGRTIELENSLIELKRWIEEQPNPIVMNSAEANMVVAQYFLRSKAANIALEKEITIDGKRYSGDVVLQFGKRHVVIETKYLRYRNNLQNVRAEAVMQVDRFRNASGIHQACVVLFVQGAIPDSVVPLEKHANGEILSIAIQATPK